MKRLESLPWLELLLVAGPLSLIVHQRCNRMGLNPLLPLAGLALGVLAELLRK